MSKKEFVATFAYRLMEDNSLFGLWGNEDTPKLFTDCCIRIDDDISKTPFGGVYTSTWLEPTDKGIDSNKDKLTITKVENSVVYKLSWENTGFTGHGFIVNSILVGSYFK